ncbi:hypothetical protein DWZ35_24985, partial [Bacteroides caccae]
YFFVGNNNKGLLSVRFNIINIFINNKPNIKYKKGLLSVRFNIINIFINNKPNIKYKTYVCAIIV